MYPYTNFDPVYWWRFEILIGSEHGTAISWSVCTAVHYITCWKTVIFSYFHTKRSNIQTGVFHKGVSRKPGVPRRHARASTKSW